MRILIAVSILSILMFGCMPEKKAAVKPQTNSAKTQQMLADQAQAEMDEDIKNGYPSIKEPSYTKPAAQQKPQAVEKPQTVQKPEEPKEALPERKVTTLGSLKPVTKYPMQGEYPVWFYTPVYDGYIGAVGIAPKQRSGGLSAQKRVAKMQAQKELAKQIEVLVKSEVSVETLNVDKPTVKYYQEKINSMTRESADQFLTGFKVQDEWIDDKTGEYYMWMVLQK